MEILKTIITIIFVIDCIALSAIILLQEGKSAGLGTISGAEQRTFYGRCTCKVYKVPGNFVYSFGCGFEPQCI